MNCDQARSLLTAYRELKNEASDTTELDVHLEGCASCRQFLAGSMLVSKSIRGLAEIEPPLDMHAQLMLRLAGEHIKFMHKAPPGSVATPEFLKPYLQEQVHSTLASHPMGALSTAETGPLPIIHAKRPDRAHARRPRMNQFAILGLAAVFLMVLMMGGVTSFVILAQRNAQQIANVSSKNVDTIQHVDISAANYSTSTLYPHIVSAVADSNSIYYTAYSDGATSQWMLLQMSRDKQISTPLLANAGQQPMIVLGSSPDWLVWLQYGTPQIKPNHAPGGKGKTVIEPWSVYYLSLAQAQSSLQSGTLPTSKLLLKDDFVAATAPLWVHTPVQGIWFMQDTLLVAALDAKGNSHLLSYQLELVGKPLLTTIATAPRGHVITSPTANSTGGDIYWSDEWISEAGYLSSDIWQQHEVDTPQMAGPAHGRQPGQRLQVKQPQLFRPDGISFHPQIADDVLFWISTAPQSMVTQGTPLANSPQVTSTPQTSTTLVPRVDTAFYTPPLDASVRGLVQMQLLNGDIGASAVPLSSSAPAYSLQVGNDFVLWQTEKGYEMYDVSTQGNVTVGSNLNSAAFLAVNGSTAVWINNTASTNTPVAGTALPPAVHIFAFNWPK